MHKKKIQALVVAGLLAIAVIGGTLAWFTSQDQVTNVFNAGSVDDPTNPNAGIEIEENFPGSTKDPSTGDMTYNKPVLPGDTLTKEVSVTSTADYDQFVRAKITKVWKLGVAQKSGNGGEALDKGAVVTYYKVANGKVVYSNTGGSGWTALDYDNIELTLATPVTSTGNTWSASKDDAKKSAEGYYYYNDILKGSKTAGGPGTTSNLLKAVTLDDDADNVYKNLRFDVKVEAEGIQATNGAASDAKWSNDVPSAKIDGYNEK